MFEDLVKNTNHCRIISRLKPVDQRKLEILSDVFTAIPKEYMAFLQEVGAGELGNANYMLYEQIIEGSEIFTSQFCIKNVYLFGDDFNGYCQGFELGHKHVIEIDPSNMSINIISPDFACFIRRKIAEIDKGS